MNNAFLLLMLCITFAFGTFVGDTYAPFSGATTQALSKRCVEMERRVADLEARCAALESSVGATKLRLELWLGGPHDEMNWKPIGRW